MKENDSEHRAFEAYCKENCLDNSMHPLHLLYLNENTKSELRTFKAGFLAGKIAALSEVQFTVDDAIGLLASQSDCYGQEDVELVMQDLAYVQSVTLANRANELLKGKS